MLAWHHQSIAKHCHIFATALGRARHRTTSKLVKAELQDVIAGIEKRGRCLYVLLDAPKSVLGSLLIFYGFCI